MASERSDPPPSAAPALSPDSEPVLIFSGDDMGESEIQWEICRLIVELLRDCFAAQGRKIKVGGNLTFQYREGDAAARVVPDVYVLEDEPPEAGDIACWQTYAHGGKVPALAIEVVSRTAKKDYAQSPEGMLRRYEEMGVPELVRYDPTWQRHPRSQRRLLSHFVRSDAGKLEEQAPLLSGDRVLLRRFGLLLVHRAPGRLRLALGAPEHLFLWPTRAERIAQAEARAAEEAQRAAAEAERAAAEAERATAEAERAERAEDELRTLRAELARLRGGSP